jgi:hypothetical protein
MMQLGVNPFVTARLSLFESLLIPPVMQFFARQFVARLLGNSISTTIGLLQIFVIEHDAHFVKVTNALPKPGTVVA